MSQRLSSCQESLRVAAGKKFSPRGGPPKDAEEQQQADLEAALGDADQEAPESEQDEMADDEPVD